MRLKVYLYVIFAVLVGFMVVSHLVPASAEGPADWVAEFPLIDFSIRSIDFGEIDFDGARRDTITPVRIPQFIQVSDTETVGVFEPVLSVIIDGDARAYPLAILLWHEIVNDVVGGVPINQISSCSRGGSEPAWEDGEQFYGFAGREKCVDDFLDVG